MKRFLFALAAAVAVSSTGALAADVGVSITIGHPDFFGRIELGNVPPPPVVYARPVIIERPAREVVVEPIYLRVPPGHQKNWKKYCAHYDACGRPVYFVKDEWYRDVYAPRYREEHREFRREEERREDRREQERREEYRAERREEEQREERREEYREHEHDRGQHRGWKDRDDHHDDRDDHDHH